MNALRLTEWISPAQYLAQEFDSESKHEYVAGAVYAMSGARIRHNRICVSLLRSLANQLAGLPCETFNSDMKVRIQLSTQTRFYYPDAMVVCQSNPELDSFQDLPKVVVEVLSSATRRLDLGEKREGYLSIPSLSVYLLVEQSEPAVVAYRRTDQGFVRETYQGLDVTVPLPEIGAQLSLAEIYERVDFESELDEER